MFSAIDQDLKEVPSRMETLDLIAVGDVSLACPMNHAPFKHVGRYLRTGDIVFGNLECVLCDAGVAAEKEITLRAPARRAECLRWAGFNILSLANNHTLDFGSTGLAQTCSVLRHYGIPFIGAGDQIATRGQEIVECRDLKVGFLAYGEADAGHIQDGVFFNCIQRDAILDQLRDLKRRCEVVIVSLQDRKSVV